MRGCGAKRQKIDRFKQEEKLNELDSRAARLALVSKCSSREGVKSLELLHKGLKVWRYSVQWVKSSTCWPRLCKVCLQ